MAALQLEKSPYGGPYGGCGRGGLLAMLAMSLHIGAWPEPNCRSYA